LLSIDGSPFKQRMTFYLLHNGPATSFFMQA